MTSRRHFVLATGAMALTSLRALGQVPARKPRIGYAVMTARSAPYNAALEKRLRELGYIDGENMIFEFRSSETIEEFSVTAKDLARLGCEVYVGTGSEAQLRAIMQVAGSKPIVMIAGDYDPVARGIIASLGRPGGNITGVTLQHVETAAKRLDLLKEALPGTVRVAALCDARTRDQAKSAIAAAAPLGITVTPYELDAREFLYEAALDSAVRAKAGAVLLLSSGQFFRSRFGLMSAATKRRLPVIGNANYAEAGALISYGPSFPEMYRLAAEYVDRILKGANPATMPVEQPTRFETIVNLRSAKALGIRISPALLARADKVIE